MYKGTKLGFVSLIFPYSPPLESNGSVFTGMCARKTMTYHLLIGDHF